MSSSKGNAHYMNNNNVEVCITIPLDYSKLSTVIASFILTKISTVQLFLLTNVDVTANWICLYYVIYLIKRLFHNDKVIV